MKIYLTHNYAAREWLRLKIVPMLAAHGHEITSRWILDDTQLGLSKSQCAENDLFDIDTADCLILFNSQFSETPGRGKFIELGYAIADKSHVIVISDSLDCVFYNLPFVKVLPNIEEVLIYLRLLDMKEKKN